MPSFSKPPVLSAEEAAVAREVGRLGRLRASAWASPMVFDRALAARAGELRGVKIRGGLALRPRAVLEADPEGEHFSLAQLALLAATTARRTTRAARTTSR